MGTDDAKRLILARRAKFVAAAVAGIAAACGGAETSPEPCLSQVLNRDAGPDGEVSSDASADAEPRPCLDLPLTDASTDAGDDAEPQPCLSPLPPDAGDAGDGG